MTMSVSTFFLRVSMPSCACNQPQVSTLQVHKRQQHCCLVTSHQTGEYACWHTHLVATSSTLKRKGICYNTNSKNAGIFGHSGNNRCCSCPSASPHACCDEDLQKVFECLQCAWASAHQVLVYSPCLHCQQRSLVPPKTLVLPARQVQDFHQFLQP